MNSNLKSPAGGGCLIFAGFLLGAILGILYGEPSLGVLIGVGIGVVLALGLWLVNRK
jgi:hypothetical protein